MDRLRNKITLITGAAKGQGAYEADIFASEGATVILADVDIQACKAIQKKIESAGGKAISLHLDVTSESDWKRCVRDIERTFGGLNVLVNNAGIYSRVPILKSSVKEFEQIIDVNLKGVFLGTKYSIPLMQIFGSGSIVNISSTAGLVGNQGGGAYGASKGGVRLFTKYTAIQHAKDKIRAKKMGIKDLDKKYNLNEIIKGDSIFCASGITSGDLVDGVKLENGKYITETLVTHKSSTINIVKKELPIT